MDIPKIYSIGYGSSIYEQLNIIDAATSCPEENDDMEIDDSADATDRKRNRSCSNPSSPTAEDSSKKQMISGACISSSSTNYNALEDSTPHHFHSKAPVIQSPSELYNSG